MNFRLDRTAFKIQTLQEASDNFEFWNSKTDKEKLSAAMYLNSVAYNFPLDNPPRLDRTLFKITHRGDKDDIENLTKKRK